MSDLADQDTNPNREPPTYAAFSPTSSLGPAQRTTVVIHQKSPLLLATPPQVTRALAYSHPFVLPLSKLLGLLSWTTNDPWESFLLVAAFWSITLCGDVVLRWTGPLLLAIGLVLGMYSRRYSALSSTFNHSHTRNVSSTDFTTSSSKLPASTNQDANHSRHHKSLDSILDTITTMTHRCNILLAPFIQLTDFLSTQRTATSSTTSPALAALFIRLLALTPIWFALTLPPLYIITTKRTILTFGTLILTWHSRPAKVSRIILWRSRTIRRICSLATGLSFTGASTTTSALRLKRKSIPDTKSHTLARKASQRALNTYSTRGKGPGIGTGEGIRFTFSLFENQRRWLGIGWTSSMLAYERTAWTDDELTSTSPKDAFHLPSVDGGVALWRWVPGSEWRIEISDAGDTYTPPTSPEVADSDAASTSTSTTTTTSKSKTKEPKETAAKPAQSLEKGWLYTDTKWRYPRRGQDGWGKYTRRRKWVREAELVDIDPDDLPIRDEDQGAELVELEGSSPSPPKLPPRPSPHTRGKSGLKTRIVGSGAGPAAPGGGLGNMTESAMPGSATNTPLGTPVGSPSKRGWFGRKRTTSFLQIEDGEEGKDKDKDNATFSGERDSDREDDGYIPLHLRGRQGAVEADWGVSEDVGGYLG